jgi:hypothetical protein
LNEAAAREAQDRAHRAKLLINDPLLAQAFADIEETLIASWRDSTSDRLPLREDAWRSLKLLEKLKGALEKHIRDGSVAERDLLELQKKKRFGIV